MKRAIAFVTALVITAGAVAPAVSAFAADLPAIPSNTNDLSIWDTSSSTPENPYNTTDVFNSVNDMWGDLFDDGRFNNTTVSDFQRAAVESTISKYIAAHPDEEVNGVTVSYFDEIVDYVCAHPADFDIYWHPDALSMIFLGDPYTSLRLGDHFFDNLKEYVLANYYTIPSTSSLVIGSGTWLVMPFSYSYGQWWASGSVDRVINGATQETLPYTVYFTNVANTSMLFCIVAPGDGTRYVTMPNNFPLTSYYYGSVSSGPYNTLSGQCHTLSSQYSSLSVALADFYGNTINSGGDPVSNGKVYLRDAPLGGDTLNFSLPSYPVSNGKAVSNYYYNTYGDTWEDNSEINDNVYNNNLTTLYPVTYDNNIPLWLIQSNSIIETFDYSLELPSAPLETLPSDFEGGGSFFQNSFVVLGGFGAFVLVGLSFSLVGLFFKE